LKFEELKTINSINNNTIEIARVRLHIEEDRKAFAIDVLNIYILLIYKGNVNDE